jgi:hypothetical protein
VSWVESHSLSFSARHDSDNAEAAAAVLERLEVFRSRLSQVFARTPGEVSVVMHPRPLMLAFAHPWLPIARLASAPASRRYFAGWFSRDEIHVLAPQALERRASSVPGSRQALMLTPEHEYAHLVLGANNPDLPPPFSGGGFRRYVRWAWLCEGAAAHFSGQTPHLRAAIVRRLHEGPRPEFPPSTRDAQLLGGTVFALAERIEGRDAAVELAGSRDDDGPRRAIEWAFGRRVAEVAGYWRDYLESLKAS